MNRLSNSNGVSLTRPRFISDVKYDCVVIDPPWPTRWVENEYTKSVLRYEPMSVQQLGELPIIQLLNNPAWVFLWTTCSFIEDSFKLVRQWGLQYRQFITWAKPYGMGRPPLTATEHVLMCGYGYPKRPLIRGPANFNYFTTNGGSRTNQHSTKPDEFFDKIRPFLGTNNLEMFARTQRDGWDSWGHEAPTTNNNGHRNKNTR